jgi:hypothetical protein
VIHHDRANVRSGDVPPRLGYRRMPDDMTEGGSGVGRDEVRWELTAGQLATSRVRAVLAEAGHP